jgi:tRNA pseudouridine32 synthase / 23S rRNA pseudouridine746 synthase
MEIIYETPDLLAVTKPISINTIPAGKEDSSCLLFQLQEGRNEKLWVFDRLDKEVSGIVLFSRNAEMNKYVNGLQAKGSISATYLALVIGKVKDEEGLIDAPIKEFGSGRMGVALSGGKAASTSYKVLARGKHHTLLEVKPLSLRRHQVRVHLFHIGFPIAGDQKYGIKEKQSTYSRLLLHAYTLDFTLPGGENNNLCSKPTDDFNQVLKIYGIPAL